MAGTGPQSSGSRHGSLNSLCLVALHLIFGGRNGITVIGPLDPDQERAVKKPAKGDDDTVASGENPSTLNPQPSTLNPQPSTLNHKPQAPNPEPGTLNYSDEEGDGGPDAEGADAAGIGNKAPISGPYLTMTCV